MSSFVYSDDGNRFLVRDVRNTKCLDVAPIVTVDVSTWNRNNACLSNEEVIEVFKFLIGELEGKREAKLDLR